MVVEEVIKLYIFKWRCKKNQQYFKNETNIIKVLSKELDEKNEFS